MILAERRNRRSRCESDAGRYPDGRLRDLYINVLEFLSLRRFSAQYHGAEPVSAPCYCAERKGVCAYDIGRNEIG